MPSTTPPPHPQAAPRAQVILAPQPPPQPLRRPSIFLAGTIDSSADGSTPWRTQLATSISHLPVTILDPTRPDWDASWREEAAFAPFREQVEWELDIMGVADVVVVYLAPGSQSPVSLLELGLCVGFAGGRGEGNVEGKGEGQRRKHLVVGCPEGYWKRGNVQVVCGRLGVEVLGSLEELIRGVEERLLGLVGRGVRDGE
jgi:hypothetical protein